MSFDSGSLITAQLLNRLLVDSANSAAIATAENLTNPGSYVDLPAGAGPSVTLTSAGSRALVIWTANAFGTTATFAGGHVGVAISGATTTAATDAKSYRVSANNAGIGIRSAQVDLFSINPGTNTYTLKYKTAVTQVNFSVRWLMVLAP